MATVTEIRPHWDDNIVFRKDPNLDLETVFLAGTIDMGNSEDWQKTFIEELKTVKDNLHEFIVYNPRRDKGFDDDQKEFEYQVNWELERLEKCDAIINKALDNGSEDDMSIVIICADEDYQLSAMQD